jgi:putative PLP-dependent aminotransferase (TIGR04422 family)
LTTSYFIWPESSALRALVSAPRFVSVAIVEKQLKSMFPSGHPVLCSSGRSALTLALIMSEVSRSDLIGVFPYASHCVLDAVSRIAIPFEGQTPTSVALRVIYHQWGFVQEKNLPPNTIEDCVDTLCLPGTTLFPGGGRFEIWSLPKILGTSSGGVLWCRDEETAETVRRIRDCRGGGLYPWLIRLLSKQYPRAYSYWQSAESDMGCVSRFQTGEIFAAILNWENFVSDRQKKINMIWPYSIDWLQKPADRLSPVAPVSIELPERIVKDLGISSGYRMFERVNLSGSRNLKKTLPIPIHQGVPAKWLNNLILKLKDYGASEVSS